MSPSQQPAQTSHFGCSCDLSSSHLASILFKVNSDPKTKMTSISHLFSNLLLLLKTGCSSRSPGWPRLPAVAEDGLGLQACSVVFHCLRCWELNSGLFIPEYQRLTFGKRLVFCFFNSVSLFHWVWHPVSHTSRQGLCH